MAIELRINHSESPDARFITYAPAQSQLRQTGGSAPLTVKLTSRRANASGGEAVFFEYRDAPSVSTLQLTLPANGDWVSFFVGGKWQAVSTDRDDCLINVTHAAGASTFPCMVRLRKNANRLSSRERDRFLGALAVMHASGLYQAFRNVHVLPAHAQEHGGPYFLPWHRAYILDFERELQAIDPAVTLPYWRFDEPAPNVFSGQFLGATKQVPSRNASPSQVTLSNGHALASWRVDNVVGILRSACFDPVKGVPLGLPASFPVKSQEETLAMGTSFAAFARMEGSPHGAAHVSFLGPIDTPDTAPQDPLFFLLHCNVDRLWALWQWLRRRRDPNDPNAYEDIAGKPRGWKLADTLWPWDGDQQPPRPQTPPPRGAFATSPPASAPGAQPLIRNMIDSEGSVLAGDWLGCGYDDVPFEEA